MSKPIAATRFIDPTLPPGVKAALDNILCFEVQNIMRYENAAVYDTPAPHRCSFTFIVKREPSYTYHLVTVPGGEHLVARCEETGMFHSYTHIPGSTDGFAGAKIELWVHGGTIFPKLGRHKRTYKGSLWSTATAKKAAEEHFGTRTVSAAYRSVSSRYSCGICCEMDARVFTAILRMSGLSIIGQSEQVAA